MDNHNSISYADNWKSASTPVRRTAPKNITPKKQKCDKKKPVGRPLLTLIQIIICLLIVLSAFVLKTFGSELYKNVKKAYEDELNNEIILNPYENSLDKLINASQS